MTIRALIQKLPEKGPWDSHDRVTWMKILAMAFDIAYGPGEWVTQIDNKKAAT